MSVVSSVVAGSVPLVVVAGVSVVMGDAGVAGVESLSEELLQAEATSSAARRTGASGRMGGYGSSGCFVPIGTQQRNSAGERTIPIRTIKYEILLRHPRHPER
jgi:hypothetical protein